MGGGQLAPGGWEVVGSFDATEDSAAVPVTKNAFWRHLLLRAVQSWRAEVCRRADRRALRETFLWWRSETRNVDDKCSGGCHVLAFKTFRSAFLLLLCPLLGILLGLIATKMPDTLRTAAGDVGGHESSAGCNVRCDLASGCDVIWLQSPECFERATNFRPQRESKSAEVCRSILCPFPCSQPRYLGDQRGGRSQARSSCERFRGRKGIPLAR